MSHSIQPQAIVIGASAGALDALSHILPLLPAGYPLPVLIVVHLLPNAKSMMPELFAAKCRVTVKEAEDKEPIQAGTVYFAPPNYHLLVELDHTLSLSSDEPEIFSRPAINVLFESAAEAFKGKLVGIVLTGASSDGAHGLKVIAEAGGATMVQNPQTAQIRVMPESALESCPSARSLTLDEIAQRLLQSGSSNLIDVE